MTIEIALLISVISVAFSIYFGLKNSKRTDTKDIEERVKNNTTINMKLDSIATAVQEIKEDSVVTKRDIHEHNDRIIKVEESAKQAHHRIDSIETRLNSITESDGGRDEQ